MEDIRTQVLNDMARRRRVEVNIRRLLDAWHRVDLAFSRGRRRADLLRPAPIRSGLLSSTSAIAIAAAQGDGR